MRRLLAVFAAILVWMLLALGLFANAADGISLSVSALHDGRVPAGSNIRVTVSGTSGPVEFYRNEENIGETSGDSFLVPILAGENHIYAVTAKGVSDTISIYGTEYADIAIKLAKDFESGDVTSGFTLGLNGGSFYGETVDEEYGTSLAMHNASGSRSFFNPPSALGSQAVLSLEAHMRYSALWSKNLLGVKASDNSWIMSFKETTSGTITFTDADQTVRTVYRGLEANKWFKVRVLYDVLSRTGTLLVNDEVLVSNQPLPNQTFTELNYVEITMGVGTTEVPATVWMDNFCEKLIAPIYTAKTVAVDGDGNTLESGVDYENPKVAVEFSEYMRGEDLNANHVAVTSSIGENISCGFEYINSEKRLYLTPTGSLIPNSAYHVQISEKPVTLQGAKTIGGVHMTFFTKKQPFRIEACTIDGFDSIVDVPSSQEITVNAVVVNEKKENIKAIILAGIYKNGALCSVNSTAVSGNEENTIYPLTLKTPGVIDETCAVKLYMINSFDVQEIVDLLVME